MKDLDKKIEGILFVSGESVEIEEIQNSLLVTKKEIAEAVEILRDRYKDRGIKLLEFENKLQFSSNGDFAKDIEAVLSPIRERKFSQSMLETISIIAYKQPVTRLDVEKIRGVSSDYAISNLLHQDIIKVVGRKDAVGKPYLFGTTEMFLKKFNLNDISALPSYEELTEKLKEIELVGDEEDDEIIVEDDLINSSDFLDEEDVEIIE